MPVLKNARHEKFAQARAKGNTVDEAYVVAGF
ncbi:terminase small subunit, partial [Sinorhizobium medicae]|nr:terminase small subunit [Sinorhizobium medicae]